MQKLKGKSKKYGLLIILLAFIMLTGCAKSVTPLFPLGKTITFEINYQGDIDASTNRYYIVISSASAPQIPFTPIEFIEPDDTPVQPEIDYFNTYYPTWDDYLVLEGNSIYLMSGPFITSEAVTQESIATWSGVESKKIQIDIDLTKLNTSSNLIYFDFITLDYSDKIVKDNLSSSNNTVSSQFIDTNYSGVHVSGTDDDSAVIDDPLDILNWSVTVQ